MKKELHGRSDCIPVFLSTFPPRRCGLATFTEDLVSSMDGLSLLPGARVIAITNDGVSYKYDNRVCLEIRQENEDSYEEAARSLDGSGNPVVSLQHEFGIFGGSCGRYVLSFLEASRAPVVTTFHTIVPAPTSIQQEVVKEICSKSEKAVVMAMKGKDLLVNRYGVKEEKVEVIPHGVPIDPPTTKDKELLKELYGFGGKRVISTFGLLSPGKGIENMIRAMPSISSKCPDAVYLVLGQTHPVIRDLYGESHRQRLVDLSVELGVGDNVAFVGHYLTKQEIVDYLAITDVYVTPYTNPEQICSGTLAYAVSAGKAVVSTPYIYAVEMLGDGRGLITPFNDPIAFAKAVTELLQDDAMRCKMEDAARAFGASMGWPEVAKSYARIFAEVSGVA